MFEKNCVLNFDLVDAVLASNDEEKKEKILKQLSNEQEVSVQFINEYIDRSKYLEQFITRLVSNWPNMWHYLLNSSNYTEERIEEYFLLQMKYGEVDDLEKREKYVPKL